MHEQSYTHKVKQKKYQKYPSLGKNQISNKTEKFEIENSDYAADNIDESENRENESSNEVDESKNISMMRV